MPKFQRSLFQFQGRGGDSLRGKLRDKPTNAKQYRLRRELMERRRPAKRENRATNLQNQQWEDDDDPLDENKELLAVAQKQKK
jgi:hypothetical protein